MKCWCPVLLTFVALSPLGTRSAGAQTPVDSAIRVVGRQLEAMRAGDYVAAARLTNASQLRRIRAQFDSLLRADTTNYLAQRIFRLDRTSAVQKLPDDEFTAHLMTFTFGLRGLSAFLSGMRGVELAGGVRVGADTVVVVYRWRAETDSLTPHDYNTSIAVRCAQEWCPASAGNFGPLLDVLKAPMVRVPVDVKVVPR